MRTNMFSLYIALAEIRLWKLDIEPTDAHRRQAEMACASVSRSARHYCFALVPSLRQRARLAYLCGRRKKAESLWRRALATAQSLGAQYELR